MDKNEATRDCSKNSPSESNMKHPCSRKNIEKSSSGPTILFVWMWNWFTNLPNTVSNMFSNVMNGKFRSTFSVIDAMLQFMLAVATSCHPEDDGTDDEEIKPETASSGTTNKDLKIFGGSGKTLRSRTVETKS